MTTKKSSLVFIVDDDEVYLDALEQNLKKSSDNEITFKRFPTGEKCLDAIGEKPDIVILDYYLNSKNEKAMNGMEVLKKIKSINPDIQVLILSGQDSLEVAVNCIKNGANDYIVKSETAFVRAAHMVKNLCYNIGLYRNVRRFEIWNWIIAGGFIALLLFDIAYCVLK